MDTLDIVIIICIVIGSLAFLFIVFILFWAWRYDKRNRSTFLANRLSQKQKQSAAAAGQAPNADGDNDDTSSHVVGQEKDAESGSAAPNGSARVIGGGSTTTSDQHSMPYPSVIGAEDDANYPESVISEDINSSSVHQSPARKGSVDHSMPSGRLLHDGGSVSSMDVESYGYSLDGYAPSLATPMPANENGSQSLTQPGENTSPTASPGKIRSSGTLDTDENEEDNAEIQITMSKEY